MVKHFLLLFAIIYVITGCTASCGVKSTPTGPDLVSHPSAVSTNGVDVREVTPQSQKQVIEHVGVSGYQCSVVVFQRQHREQCTLEVSRCRTDSKGSSFCDSDADRFVLHCGDKGRVCGETIVCVCQFPN